MHVALMTLFNGLDFSYSLVNVVRDQLTMLLAHDIKVKMLVTEQCDLTHLEGIFSHPHITWCPITNTYEGQPIKWHDYSLPTTQLHDSFIREMTVIAASLLEHLQDVDVCFLHDILYQGWHYIHNIAIRQVANALPDLHFLSVTHSFPLKRPQHPLPHLLGFYTPLRNTHYVYPTISGLKPLSMQYKIPEGLCHVVSNIFNPLDFLSSSVQALHTQVNLFDTEFLIVYPARLTPGKQHKYLIHLAGSIFKTCERTVKIIFCDFPSLDIDSLAYKTALYETGALYGLTPKNIIFTTDYGFPKGFPRESVLDLFTLSNLFICPSFSESFGLTVLEAASRGNFLVLNKCVPALAELSTHLSAYLMEWPGKTFEGIVAPTSDPLQPDYYTKHATRLVQLLLQNPVIVSKTEVRQRYNPEYIWHHQLAPLLHI